MGQHQYTKLYRRVSLDLMMAPASSTGKLHWEFRTERPGTTGVMDRHTGTLEFSAAQVNQRQPRTIELGGAVRGRMFQFYLAAPTKGRDGTGALYLFGARVYRKILHPHEDTTWEWQPIPIPGTADTWATTRLPIPPTSDEWGKTRLPIPPTADDWGRASLPIPPTPETWSQVRWPFRPTAVEPQWIQLPVDA